jgi:hypothetical protein
VVALLELAARQLRQAAAELEGRGATHALLFLPGTFDLVVERGWLDDAAVELARQGAWRARRCDLARAFEQLNPTFGEVHQGCWPDWLHSARYDATRQQQAQRGELELALGARVATALDPRPAEGGEPA